MNIEPFVDRIKTAFPEFPIQDVSVPSQGIDHVALAINKEWIFRFPNREEYKAMFPNEVRLLELLHPRIPLSIPHYTMLAPSCSFGGYKMMHGEELTVEVFESLSRNAKITIATQIAEFLTALHTVPKRDLDGMKLPIEDNAASLVTLRKEYDTVVAPFITPAERKACEQFFHDFSAMIPQVPFVLTHSDFVWWHLLVHPARKVLSGVIDFGDACYQDPAKDLGGLWLYGQDFVQSVYDQYEGQKDDTFLARSLLWFKRLGMKELYYPLIGETGTVEESYPFFMKTVMTNL